MIAFPPLHLLDFYSYGYYADHGFKTWAVWCLAHAHCFSDLYHKLQIRIESQMEMLAGLRLQMNWYNLETQCACEIFMYSLKGLADNNRRIWASQVVHHSAFSQTSCHSCELSFFFICLWIGS